MRKDFLIRFVDELPGLVPGDGREHHLPRLSLSLYGKLRSATKGQGGSNGILDRFCRDTKRKLPIALKRSGEP